MKRILSYLSIAVLTVAGISCNKNLEPASIVLNHDVLNVAVGGERTTIGVKSNRDWVATVDKDWLTLTPASAEAFEASSYMILDVEPNDDLVREAIITVAAKSGEFTATMKVIQGEDGLVIKTADQFVAFMQLAASGTLTDNYRISRDIDLDGVTLPVVPELSVSLDGQGCSILGWTSSAPMFETISAKGSVSNLVLDASCTLTLPETYGHFGFITNSNSGTITGIENFADITMTALPSTEATAYVGAICGDSNGYIADCSNYGNITYAGGIGTKNAYVGAVVGRVNSASALADNLYNIGDVTATFNDVTTTSYYFTGLVGTVASNGKLLNSTNDGNVTVKAHGNKNMMVASGVTAYAGGQVAGCTNKGNITYIAETAEGLADGGVQRTGVCGIAAYMGWSGQTVDNNHNEGEIYFRAGYPLKYGACGSAQRYSTNVAGLFGHMYNCSIDNCSNSGKVTSILSDIGNSASYFNTDIRQSCGGIVASSWGKIANSENSGELNVQWIAKDRTAITDQFVAQVGGISGGDYNTVSKSGDSYVTHQNTTDITNCVNTGNINYECDANASNNSLGGIAGWPHKELSAGKSISDCENAGTITIKGSSKTRIGGISGGCIALNNCVNSGKIHLVGGQASCTIGGVSGVCAAVHPISGCENYGDIQTDVKTTTGIGGIIGNTYNQANLTVKNCLVNCNISVAAETTKTCLLIGYVDSNKSASTHVNYIGTETEPNIVSGGTLTIGSTTTTITEDNYLTYALPWGTGALINSNIKHNTIWQ